MEKIKPDTEAALRRLLIFVKKPGVGIFGDRWWIDHIEAILDGEPRTVARGDRES